MKARIMTFARQPVLVLQAETDAERALLDQVQTMRRGAPLVPEDPAWSRAATFDIELVVDLDPRYER